MPLNNSGADRRRADRVEFERGHPAHLMAIDGSWRRSCTHKEVSERGARLKVDTPINGLSLKEFFLLLSSPGLAYRRCELAWVNGDEIGVNFLKKKSGKISQSMDVRSD